MAQPAQLGFLLRKHRLAAGLSQEELAERAGISARAVSDIERGLRMAPRPETIRMLADAFALDAVDRAKLLAAARPEPIRRLYLVNPAEALPGVLAPQSHHCDSNPFRFRPPA
jgi:transcriptional regulator with XRE-family HTH domain